LRLLIQRVSEAAVRVGGETTGEIGPGLLVLAGFGGDDGENLPEGKVWRAMIDKTLGLRIFPDDAGKLNLSLEDVDGDLLLVSQFTLYADCRKGRRPSFSGAAKPETARALYERLVEDLRKRLPGKVETGVFAAEMDVSLVNAGPVTIMLDSSDFESSRRGNA
jgi:D-tyrosyl-tRNA(Tyr) deacylase